MSYPTTSSQCQSGLTQDWDLVISGAELSKIQQDNGCMFQSLTPACVLLRFAECVDENCRQPEPPGCDKASLRFQWQRDALSLERLRDQKGEERRGEERRGEERRGEERRGEERRGEERRGEERRGEERRGEERRGEERRGEDMDC
ncbi:hypothetical protein Q9966_014574 [Columba livia]|nr:hypothetical protein Q9966_014574 [Columba livia]